MLHILLLPLAWASHAGSWIDAHVLSPFQIGETAKQVIEEEIGAYGVLAYLIFKVSRLTIEAAPLVEPRWLIGQAARSAGLVAALVVEAWLLTCLYVGTLIPVLDLEVSYGGLVLAPVVAWACLGYVMLADRVRARRAELYAQSEGED